MDTAGCSKVKFTGVLPSVYRCHMSNISQYNLNLSLDWIYFRTQNICFDNKLAPGMNWKPIAINLADISNLKWKVYLHIDWSYFLSISVTDRASAFLGNLLRRSTQASPLIVRIYSHSFLRWVRTFSNLYGWGRWSAIYSVFKSRYPWQTVCQDLRKFANMLYIAYLLTSVFACQTASCKLQNSGATLRNS